MNVDSDSRLTGIVIGAAIAVHRELGPGLDEFVYERMLGAELDFRGIVNQREVPLPLRYKGVRLDCRYRLDLVVEHRLIVEIKSVEVLAPIHEAQLLTYLRLADRQLGLLINFDVPVLKQGIRRRVWTPRENAPVDEPPDQRAASEGFEPLSSHVIAAAIEVHRGLGPGLLRSAYEECLCHELAIRGIPFERGKKLPARFREVEILEAVEVPLLACGELPIVCLSVPQLLPLHRACLLTQLRTGHWRSGLLLNFNVPSLPKGIWRVVNSGI